MNDDTREVIVTDIQMPFMSMVFFHGQMGDCLDTGNHHLDDCRFICFNIFRRIDALIQLSTKSVGNLVINTSYSRCKPLASGGSVF